MCVCVAHILMEFKCSVMFNTWTILNLLVLIDFECVIAIIGFVFPIFENCLYDNTFESSTYNHSLWTICRSVQFQQKSLPDRYFCAWMFQYTHLCSGLNLKWCGKTADAEYQYATHIFRRCQFCQREIFDFHFGFWNTTRKQFSPLQHQFRNEFSGTYLNFSVWKFARIKTNKKLKIRRYNSY